MSMTNPTNQIEIITSVQRRRRWAALEKVRMVDPTHTCRKCLVTGLSDEGLGLSHPFSHPKCVSRYIAAPASARIEVGPYTRLRCGGSWASPQAPNALSDLLSGRACGRKRDPGERESTLWAGRPVSRRGRRS